MENNSYHLPFYVVTNGVATSGHSSDLVGGKVGIYDRATFSVATGIGNGKEFFFAQGNIGGKDWYGNTVTETHKSAFFFGKDVEAIRLSYPKRLQNEEWVLGYNGALSSRGLIFEKGKAIRIKFYFNGEPTYRFFNGPKEYVVSYTPKEDCTTPCSESDCPDEIGDCLVHTQNVIDLINTHTELRKFGVNAKIVTNTFSAASQNMTKWCLTLCDNGTAIELQNVQAQAPSGAIVVRTARVASQSTYQFCQLGSAGTPTAYSQTGSVLEAVCGTCPSGSFLIPSKDVFIIRRPIVGAEDFSTALSRDNYANAIWTAYASQETITTSTSTTSTTTASGTSNNDAKFIGRDEAVAIVEVKFVTGTELDPAIGTDIIEFARTEPATCVFATPASTAWVSCGTAISSSRTMKISGVNRTDCDGDDRTDDLTDILTGVDGILINTLTKISGDDCADDYTVTQNSSDCLDEACLTNNVTFTYADLPAFESHPWELVPATVEEDDTRKCGIRVTAGYVDPRFGDCSFNPTDYYETSPLKMEVSLLQEDGSNCDAALWPTQQQTQFGQFSRQTGEYIVRELIMKTDAYLKHIRQFDLEPRMREAFDMNLLTMVDRTAYYKLYYVRFKASYGHSYRKNEQEKFTAVFAFKENDASALSFEANVLSVLTAKSGVALEVETF